MRATMAGVSGKIKRASLAEILSPDVDMGIVYVLLGTIAVGIVCVMVSPGPWQLLLTAQRGTQRYVAR